ncbi:MAG TPA: substrate-binding domain-containing protein, partial [Daejeonella sp.]|nr:substrate-binding domain-containing protein [Daejeonella sp.]
MRLYQCIGLLLTGSIFWVSCQNANTSSETTYTKGKVDIVVDESFAPIVEDQAYVFESNYTESKLNLILKPENQVLNLFLTDSVRVAILSRELTPGEAKYYENKKIRLRVNRFAVDGIALITQRTNPDSTITVAEIISILKGQSKGGRSLVFDS